MSNKSDFFSWEVRPVFWWLLAAAIAVAEAGPC